jgi:putative membrane protein
MANEAALDTLSDSTVLSIERTRLAGERTMMAWIRTATSLITFGFSVYKFFDIQRETTATTGTHDLIGHREFAIMLILVGMLSLVVATFQQRQHLEVLRHHYRSAEIPRSAATILAGLISLLGVAALWAVVFRQ